MSDFKNICILGAGAMGGLIGGLIQRAGHHVTYIARGAQLEALRTHGITLETSGDQWHGPARATNDPIEAGKQDVIIVCTKTHQ